ncbi:MULTISPECIES: abortive infection family protein [unclassified Ectothiorhodospira]|uniref:type II toxin-antitoxin system RelE/ParE family toxin n=1 Tax=unclassified Ectothiorhodospira TaxID=2684909 RepID=UPI001EE8E876|nr:MULTISPECIES: abortive infection family protein [unclassified Ectothiorhodospira]MCG5514727.1 abortive infection family protein [Ectothiorhodospira sp. 9100]MCG5518326.1 abortive infection family protein [Ectothiorhodospira sp. 9905]
MDFDVRWSPEATEDLEAIAKFIARDSEFYARAVVSEMLSVSRGIGEFPYMGRTVPEIRDDNIRERFVYNYRLIYRIASGMIHIVAVIPGKRLNQIISGVVEIRNAHGSAARGADAYAPLLDSRYAEILTRSTDAVVGLLFRTHLESARREPLARFVYEEHADFNEAVDNEHGPFQVLDIPLIASEALYRTDFQAYRAALVQFKQEQAENGGD